MLPKHLKLPLILLCAFALLVALTPTVQAATSILPACVSEGYCTLCDILQLFINFGKFLLGIVGSLALLMFVYGGFMWLTSGGETGKIDAGKKILINSVIGVAITFFAWVIVTFVVGALTASSGWKWDADLACAPLPGLEPAVVEDRGSGTGTGAASKKKEGESCATTPDCEMTLYCEKTKAVCTKKIPIRGVCKDKELKNQDNLACESGYCTGWFGNAFIEDCITDQCCKSDLVAGGGPCDASKPCQPQFYCKRTAPGSTSGTCEYKLPNGGRCNEADVVGNDSDDICENDKCISRVCVYSPLTSPVLDTVEIGGACANNCQCKGACTFSEKAAYGLFYIDPLLCANPVSLLPTITGDKPYCYTKTKEEHVGVCRTGTLSRGEVCEETIVWYCTFNREAPCGPNDQCYTKTLDPTGWTGKCRQAP